MWFTLTSEPAMSYASYADGPTGGTRACRPRSPRRALEIVGIVFAFFWFWPLAAAYIAWKCMGYPVPEGLREPVERVYGAFGGFTPLRDVRWNAAPFTGTGNCAFDDYRRAEIERINWTEAEPDQERGENLHMCLGCEQKQQGRGRGHCSAGQNQVVAEPTARPKGRR